MNTNSVLSPHESLELHEMIRSEALLFKKMQTSLPVVQDDELKQFMLNSVNQKQTTVNDLDQIHFKAKHDRF